MGSSLGALLGYWLGLEFYELIGRPIVEFYAVGEQYERVQVLYQQWDAVAIAVAGFTPIPFKIFTIAAGLFEINLITFVVVVVLSRGARFFLLGGLIWWFGPSIQNFVDRYFNLLVILFSILLVGGFLSLKICSVACKPTRRGQPVADPNRTSGTYFTHVESVLPTELFG